MNLKNKLLKDFLKNPDGETYYLVLTNANIINDSIQNRFVYDEPSFEGIIVKINSSTADKILSCNEDEYKIILSTIGVKIIDDATTIASSMLIRAYDDIMPTETRSSTISYTYDGDDFSDVVHIGIIDTFQIKDVIMFTNESSRTLNIDDIFYTDGEVIIA